MKNIFSLVLLLFFFQAGNAQTIDRSKQPQPGPPPVIKIKDPEIFTLPNGLTVMVVENHKLPRVSATLTIDRGPSYEKDKVGVNSLMGAMLNEGTTTLDKEAFDKKVELMGASVNLNSSGGSASSLTRYFSPSLELMAEALKHPAMKKESFDKIKERTLNSLKLGEKNAELIASRMVQALNYGKNSPQGEFETQQSIEGLTLEDIKKAYADNITPSRAYLIFSGDITTKTAKTLAEKYFGNWKGKKLTFPKIAPVENPSQTQFNIIDLPSAVQTQIYVTNLINNPMTNPDYHALVLANKILGGGSEGKLFQNLREKHGFTYGSYSSVGSGRFQSLVSSSAQVRTEKTDSAVIEIFRELKNMQEGNITKNELDLAKAVYNGSFALNMENPSLAATYALNILTNDLPKDFYRTFLQKINAVTIEDIKRVANKYFLSDRSRIIIVGNAEKIVPGLQKINVPINYFDQYGNPVEPASLKPVEGDKNITAQQVIDNYIKAVGGKEAISKITSFKADIEMGMMGRKLTGVMKKMSPYSTLMQLEMNGMQVMKLVFDGTSGYQSQMGQKTPMSADDIKGQKDEKGIFPQLLYNTGDYKLSLDGTGKLNGEDVYKVKVVKPSGTTATEYYSIKTGLFLKTSNTMEMQGQQIEQSVVYGDYKKVDGILTAMSVTQHIAGQEIAMTLSNVKYNADVTAEDFK